jgi:hypothetical protein
VLLEGDRDEDGRQTYERPLAELPAIQSSIANSVADALRTTPRR